MAERFADRLQRVFTPRVLSFGLVGLSGVAVNLSVLFVLADLFRLPAVSSSAVAIEVSILSNFLLNNALTFRDKNAEARAGFVERMLRYNLVGLAGLAVQLGTFVLLTRAAVALFGLAEPGPWKYPAQLAGIALGMVVNFATNFYWTWQQRSEESARGDEA